MFLALVVLAVSLFGWLAPVLAQLVPVGSELQVNTYTTSGQRIPGVAADPDGNFVVVWESNRQDGSYYGIFGQRFDSSGALRGGEFQVNNFTSITAFNYYPKVAADAAGNFVVVWMDRGPRTGYHIFGQRFDSSGAAQGDEFRVNTSTATIRYRPAVAADPAGKFVVVWTSLGQDGSLYGVFGQRFDSEGAPQGENFQVNIYTTSWQRLPAVAMDGSGNFFVVWTSSGQDGSISGIFGRRYNSSGVAEGGEFRVNSHTPSLQYAPSVAADGMGNFVVVWTSFAQDGSYYGIFGQRLDSSGAPRGGEFQVNAYTTGAQLAAAVAADPAGNFLVVWQSREQDGSDNGVFGQRYDSSGVPEGPEFRVNSYTTSRQATPAVGADPAGNFLVAWTSSYQDGSSLGVFAQRYISPTTTSTSSTSSTTSSSTSSTTSSSTTSSTLPPTDLLPGRIVIIRPDTLAKFIAKPVPGDTFALPSANPVTEAGALRIFDTHTTAGDDTYALPAGGTPPVGWKALGNPPGSTGYRYKGAGTPGDPCKALLLKSNAIKAVCRGSDITLQPPFTGDVGIVLSIGTTDRYCARLGGVEVRNDATATTRRNAPAPGGCP